MIRGACSSCWGNGITLTGDICPCKNVKYFYLPYTVRYPDDSQDRERLSSKERIGEEESFQEKSLKETSS